MPVAQPDLDYRWVPGQGCDPAALENMRRHFPMPDKPMGESWFIGERKFYPELMGDLSALAASDIYEPLEAIVSGTTNFGRMDEWRDWLHYLLPRLRHLWHSNHTVFESLISGVFQYHPVAPLTEPYEGFRSDLLKSVGRAFMDAEGWPDGRMDPEIRLYKPIYVDGQRHWEKPAWSLSAALFLCVRYLRPSEIKQWIQSVLKIEDPYWRAQVMVWLVAAEGFLSGRLKQPAEMPTDGSFCAYWCDAPLLKGDYSGDHTGTLQLDAFLPEENRTAATHAVGAFFKDKDDFLHWFDPSMRQTDLKEELGDLPHRFVALYVER